MMLLYYGEAWEFMGTTKPFYIVANPCIQESDIESKVKEKLEDLLLCMLDEDSDLLDNIPELSIKFYPKEELGIDQEHSERAHNYIELFNLGNVDEKILEILKEYTPHTFFDFTE